MGIAAKQMKWIRALISNVIIAFICLQTLAANADILSFQNGLAAEASYVGTSDTSIFENQPNTVFGLSTLPFVDGDEPSASGSDVSSLRRWDISVIPPASIIESADISIQVTNSSTGNYSVYQILAPWTETDASWNQSAAGTNCQLAGAEGSLDRGATVIQPLTRRVSIPIQIIRIRMAMGCLMV
jgi:hypothetical protein